MPSIIIAEPAGRGSWHGCAIDIADQSIRRKQLLRDITIPPEPGPDLAAQIGRQILSRTEQKDVQLLLLLSKDRRLEGPCVSVCEGFPVHIQAIDPLAALGSAVPSSWASFLLIDLGGARDCSLIKRSCLGGLECTHSAPLALPLFGTKSSSVVRRQLSGQKNGEQLTKKNGNRAVIVQLLEAARFFGVTKVLCRHGLLDFTDVWEELLGAASCVHSGSVFEFLCVPTQDLVRIALNTWRTPVAVQWNSKKPEALQPSECLA